MHGVALLARRSAVAGAAYSHRFIFYSRVMAALASSLARIIIIIISVIIMHINV